MSKRPTVLALVIAALFLVMAHAPAVSAQGEPLYKGKTVRVLVPYAPGGGFDTNARVVARHLPKHIPGEPSMIVQNMPGGGGLVGLNYFSSVAKPNGLMLAHLPHLTAFFEVSGVPQVKYKSEKFEWLGSSNSTVGPVVVRGDAHVKDLKQLLDPKTPPLIVGASGETGSLALGPRIVNEIFGREVFKVVTGYRGTAPIRMAMERKEVDGMVFGWTWDSVKATASPWLDSGFIKLIAYLARERHPEMEARKVPFMLDFIDKKEDRQLLLLLSATYDLMMRPFAAPPGTSPERVALLRKAFAETMKDPKFLADAKKMKVDVQPISAEQLEKGIRSILADTPPQVVERIRRLVRGSHK